MLTKEAIYMKKSVMTKILSLAVASAMVFSCAACSDSGKKDKDADEDEIEASEEEEEEEEEEEDEDPTPTPEPTATPTPTPEPTPATFFEEQGLTITPQGEYDLDTEWLYTDNDTQNGPTTVPFTVEIKETTEGCDEGYKMIVADFGIDYSSKYFYDYGDFFAYPPEGITNHPSSWISAFDRYTGVSFEPGDNTVLVEYEGKTYDVTCTFDWNIVGDYDNGVAADYCTVTVTCPVDYDGTVFYIGHGSGGDSQIGEGQEFDFTAKQYTIDELPYYVTNGFPYFFFSANNK
jgi:hypothetical protein